MLNSASDSIAAWLKRWPPIILSATHLYEDRFDRRFCESSLLGPYTKLWFTKELTDPSAQELLLTFQRTAARAKMGAILARKGKTKKGAPCARPK